MMKKTLLLLTLALLLLAHLEGSRALAQTPPEDLDTFLARAAATGFLNMLKRPDLAGMADFYLLDKAAFENIRPQLTEPPITGYRLEADGWSVDGKTYQVEATLQPGSRALLLYTGKHNGRWKIEAIELATTTTPPPASSTAPAGTPAQPITTTTTTTTTVVPPVATASSGGGQFLFQTQSGGGIYIINPDGTGLRYITHGIDPQLSPDGTQITFTRWEPSYELFTINVDGTGEKAWGGQALRQIKSPTWSLDGSRLLFSYQSGGTLEDEHRTINLRSIEEGETLRVPPSARGVDLDGSILRFTVPMDAYWRLGQINLTTNQFSDVPTADRYSYAPTWSPIYADQFIYRSQAGFVLHDTSQQRDIQRITTDNRDRAGVISPDGTKIAFSYWQEGHWEVHTVNMDGSGRQRLTSTPLSLIAEKMTGDNAVIINTEGFRTIASTDPAHQQNPHWNNAAPAWSPDGTQIAFLTDRTGQWEIWVMSTDGSNQRPMFPGGALVGLTLNYAGVDERMISWQ
jgi:Tol biopolymer transport system component